MLLNDFNYFFLSWFYEVQKQCREGFVCGARIELTAIRLDLLHTVKNVLGLSKMIQKILSSLSGINRLKMESKPSLHMLKSLLVSSSSEISPGSEWCMYPNREQVPLLFISQKMIAVGFFLCTSRPHTSFDSNGYAFLKMLHGIVDFNCNDVEGCKIYPKNRVGLQVYRSELSDTWC